MEASLEIPSSLLNTLLSSSLPSSCRCQLFLHKVHLFLFPIRKHELALKLDLQTLTIFMDTKDRRLTVIGGMDSVIVDQWMAYRD